MTFPPLEIYQFEDQLEQAVQAWLLQNGVNDPKRQREHKIDVDGTPQTLRTPRVEVKYLHGGFERREHYYVNQNGKNLDIGSGILYLKIVTRRGEKEQSHPKLRALCRYLMQFASQVSGLMKYHQIEKIIESQSTVYFEVDKLHDLSSLSFTTDLRIRSEFFPVS